MLFQGQEFAASSPFLYFADHREELAAVVRRGRHDFLAQFPSLAGPEMAGVLPDPGDFAVFERSRLDLGEREAHREAAALHRDLMWLRRADPVFRQSRPGGMDGAVLGPEAFLLRFFGDAGDDRLLLVNLGKGADPGPAAEPLLAPPDDRQWEVLWSSEDPRYGGSGTAAIAAGGAVRLLAESTVAFRAVAAETPDDPGGPPIW